MTRPSRPQRSPADLAGATKATGVVALGMMTMNVLAYAFTLLSARFLGPAGLGQVSAMLGVLIVANVGALALQATAARRMVTAPAGGADAVAADITRQGFRVAAGLGVLLAVLAPLLYVTLDIDQALTVLCVPLTCIPLTVMGAYAGILQGQRRWTPLALVYVAMGAGRIVAGAAFLLVRDDAASAMLGVAVGALAPAAVGWWFCRRPATAEPPSEHRPVLRELWNNGHSLLAFFAFTNADVLLARVLFDAHASGVYAAGAILAKTCLFLPTFVLVVAFPGMAADRSGRPWLKPAAAVAALGAVAVIGCLLLPDLAVAFAGGEEYADLRDDAWLFAVEGTMFALLQVLVYDTIAAQNHAEIMVWAAVIAAVVAAWLLAGSVATLVSIVAAVAAVAVVMIGSQADNPRKPGASVRA